MELSLLPRFKDGKLFWEWDSSDFPELYSEAYEMNDFTNLDQFPADYMHINSLELDKQDGNVIASFRNLNSVFKLDTTNGEIIWKLGGKDDDFNLTSEQKMSRQHFARYNSNGSITIFDNGNDNQQTRVAEYWLDETTKTVKDFKAYQIAGYYSEATGSAQRIQADRDVFVIGWGIRNDSSPVLQPNMSEIDFTSGETLFEFRFEDENIDTYRCVKY